MAIKSSVTFQLLQELEDLLLLRLLLDIGGAAVHYNTGEHVLNDFVSSTSSIVCR